MTDEKLASEVKGLRNQLFSLRSQTVTEKVEDNSQFRKIRRDIARLLMVQGERRAAGGGAAPKSASAPAGTPKSRTAKAPKSPAKVKKS